MSDKDLTADKIEWPKHVLFHGSFVFMFIMTVGFFKESLYVDSAYYIYKTIATGSFVLSHQRLVLGISEILPLIFFYSGASLKAILIVFSIGRILFYYSLFLVALYKFRSEAGAICIILLQVIGQTWLYFSPMLEICYGAALLVIFKLLLDTKRLTPLYWFWLVALEILVLTSHPENFVAFFFVVGYDIVKNGFRKHPHLILLLFFAALIVFKFLTFGEYEGNKVHFMTDLSQNHQYKNFFNANYLYDVWIIFWQQYRDLIILLSITCAYFIYKKYYKPLIFTIATVAGLIALINLTNYARVFSRYNETLYYPLVTIITITFLFEVFPMFRKGIRNIFITIFLVLFITRYQKIEKQGEYLSYRTFQLEELISQAHQFKVTKCVINLESVEKDRWVNGFYLMESLLLSSVKGPDSTVSIITNEDAVVSDTSAILIPDVMGRPDIEYQKKLPRFFNLKNEYYKLLNTTDSITKPEEFSGKINLEIDPLKFLVFYERLFIIVKIENQSGHLFTSFPTNQCYFKVYCSSSGEDFEATAPLDIDVTTNYTQVVACPIPYHPDIANIHLSLIWMGKEVAETKTSLQLN